MKSPDKIKKGLECCSIDDNHCGKDCPYKEHCMTENRYKELEADALAYIKQLEAEKDEMLETIKRMVTCGADCGGCVHLDEEPEDLKNCEDRDFDCEHCQEKCACYSCKDGSNYERQGVPLPPSSPDGESTSLGDGG